MALQTAKSSQCPVCRGRGTVTVKAGKTGTRQVTCQRCRGSGEAGKYNTK